MAGRTLHQAMAYLGLAEQNEVAHEAKRGQQVSDEYADDRRGSYAEAEDDIFDYPDYAMNTQDIDARFFAEQSDQTDEENDVLAPIIEPVRSGSRSVAVENTQKTSAPNPQKSFSTNDESEEELRRITTIHPRSYNDAKIIGESFRENIPVIMNVTDMGESEAKRLVDFSAGLAFALHGSIERVTDKVFLLTPANLEVLGAEGAEVPVALDSDSSDLFNQG